MGGAEEARAHPPRALRLNRAGIWFNIFARDVTRGGVWPSRKAVADQIVLHVRRYNGKPERPFRWAHTGEPLWRRQETP